MPASLYAALVEMDAKLQRIKTPAGCVVTVHLPGHRVEFHPLKERP